MGDHVYNFPYNAMVDPWMYHDPTIQSVNTRSNFWTWESLGESSKGRDKMRGLYRVLVVDPENDSIEEDELVIAGSEEKARIKVLMASTLTGDLDDYDVICQKLGSMRGKARPQEVKIV